MASFGPMKLNVWLKKQGMRANEFARLTGLDTSTVSRLLSGERRPEWPSLDKIVEVTGGEVTPNDFISEASASQDAA